MAPKRVAAVAENLAVRILRALVLDPHFRRRLLVGCVDPNAARIVLNTMRFSILLFRVIEIFFANLLVLAVVSRLARAADAVAVEDKEGLRISAQEVLQ